MQTCTDVLHSSSDNEKKGASLRSRELGLTGALLSTSLHSSASAAKLSFLIKGDLLLLLYSFLLLLLHTLPHHRSKIIHPPFFLQVSSFCAVLHIFPIHPSVCEAFTSSSSTPAFHFLFSLIYTAVTPFIDSPAAEQFIFPPPSINLPLHTSPFFRFLSFLPSLL